MSLVNFTWLRYSNGIFRVYFYVQYYLADEWGAEGLSDCITNDSRSQMYWATEDVKKKAKKILKNWSKTWPDEIVCCW